MVNGKISVIGIGNVGQSTIMNFFEKRIGRRGMIEVIELDNLSEKYKKMLREASEHIKKVTEIALDAL